MPLHASRTSNRRILSLWFPRLAAEDVLRAEPGLGDAPLAVVGEIGNLRQITSLTHVASARGLSRGQALAEALVLCPDLVTRPDDPDRAIRVLAALRRWAGRFSPWVAEEGADALLIDLTGCAHLFGGEAALYDQIHHDCADLGLSVCAGIADTPGAAWALSRYASGGATAALRSGDAIDQEARATRSRAQRRHWVKGGAAPQVQAGTQTSVARISPPGSLRQSLGALPIAALRISPTTVNGLARLGLRHVGDLWGMPRAGLARRFGQDLVRRLDQALGVEPEPISPAGAPLHFAARLSLPEPIGLEADILAGLDRLLAVLCDKLRARGRGARRLRLEMVRAEGGAERIEIGLARPTDRPDSLRALFALKLDGVAAGFGFDVLRLVAPVTEPLHSAEHKGGWAVAAEAQAARPAGHALDDLIARIGARVGLERITREHPGDSHIPEKTSVTQAAAYSQPAADWPATRRPRPLTLFRPEPVTAADRPEPPFHFRWRGRSFETRVAHGPERIAPEWWLDDPQWRSGVRDYWRVTTAQGPRLWLFYAHGGAISGGWFAQGDFG
ncbi:DNA polymerase Y family protein [Rhodobacterales bacterium LSUCC0031]|nr:DNA polymerase Y family protein [Rhodobacterales bacterium LSUCC0031]